jgi:hypothetical protein
MIASKLKFLTFSGWAILVFHAASLPENKTGEAATYCQPVQPGLFKEPVNVVINEIMADPTPVNGLPDAEWIELLNTAEVPVCLRNWRLTVGSVTRVLPDFTIHPHCFVILCSAQASPGLQEWGETIIFPVFPALRNTGNRIELTDESGTPIDIVEYSDDWYYDKTKKSGGWSLEKIDPERSCYPGRNWRASVDPRGGTPGSVNSVFGENKDSLNPVLTLMRCVSSSAIQIGFSEPVDPLQLTNPALFTLSDGRGHPAFVTLLSDSSAELTWTELFPENRPFTLSFNGLSDLCGNELSAGSAEVCWVVLKPGDVVINEILFNPYPEGNDFVEIFNRSSKIVETARLVIATRDNAGQLKSRFRLPETVMGFTPGSYIAITENPSGIFPYYHTPCEPCILQIANMPAFNNEAGCVVLLDDREEILDEMSYSDQMHHPMLFSHEGVSLERVHPEFSSLLRGNWHSASSGSGFATPGYQNSQYSPEQPSATRIDFVQDSFSPNGDGYNDELLVRFITDSPGWVANSHVYDVSGRPVHRLLNNTLLPVSGTISWNGRDETGHRLPFGPYVILFELFHTDGRVEHFKKAVVLTERGR